jgi:hypothetical protein
MRNKMLIDYNGNELREGDRVRLYNNAGNDYIIDEISGFSGDDLAVIIPAGRFGFRQAMVRGNTLIKL